MLLHEIIIIFVIIIILFFIINLLLIKKENFWNIPTISKNQYNYSNRINNNLLTKYDDKINLFYLIKDKKYCPLSSTDKYFSDLQKYKIDNKQIFFIKQRGAGGGSSVYPEYYENIQNKLNQLLENKNNKIHTCHEPAFDRNSNYIIQKGIEPLLFNNKKFDIRIFYIVVLYQNKLYFYISKDSLLKINSSEYKYNNIDKKNVITNNIFQNNNDNILLSNSNLYKKLFPKLKNLFIDLSINIKKDFKNIKNENKIEFQVCGADVIFNNSFEPFLLELNSGWPSYISRNNSVKEKELKIGVKNNIHKIIMNLYKYNKLTDNLSHLFKV